MKKKSSKIYELPLSFYLTRKYVVFCFKRFYSEFIVVGRENIPTEGPVIYAPNHINALMDAVAVHAVVSPKLPLIFLARADIFRNKSIARFLRFTKIMPAFRMRDGMENLNKNNEIFDQCVEILDHRKALGIMPEGNQGEQRKLRPLVKGIFRIAFTAQQQFGENEGVKIVPVGIDLGDYVKFGKHIIINIGKPIEVSEYMNLYAENQVTATNEIRNRLRNDLNNLSLNLAIDSYYDCFEIVVEVANEAVLNELKLPNKTVYRFIARQKIAERLVKMEKNEPLNMEKLQALSFNYQNALQQNKLKTVLFDNNKYSYNWSDGLTLIWTFPIFVLGFVLNFLPFFIPEFIRKDILKVKDIGFFSSLHFGLGMLTFPIFYILQTLVFSWISSVAWWWLLLFLLSQYTLGKGALRWYKTFTKLRASIRFNKLKRKKPAKMAEMIALRKEIIEMISR